MRLNTLSLAHKHSCIRGNLTARQTDTCKRKSHCPPCMFLSLSLRFRGWGGKQANEEEKPYVTIIKN